MFVAVSNATAPDVSIASIASTWRAIDSIARFM